jgi:signal transduction histidine kinase
MDEKKGDSPDAGYQEDQTGRGIAPEHLPRIFDLFSTTRHLDGGTVDTASQVGHGTTVILRLPWAPAARGAPVHSVDSEQ